MPSGSLAEAFNETNGAGPSTGARQGASVDDEDEEGEADEGSDDGDAEEGLHPGVQRLAADPYANLDGAFGSYLADEPKPMANGSKSTGGDGLLF